MTTNELEEQSKRNQQMYDQVPYPGKPFAQTHINRLALLGRLRGIQTASPDKCRVLELGCCDGGNLIPMAVEYPESDFVGIDLSPRQIEDGEKSLEAIGLNNVTLKALNILDFDESWGKFDYILTHGVFSWVPLAVRERIMEICQQHLTENGIAYISYNTRPGWNFMGTLRDLMKYRVQSLKDPHDKAEKAIAAFNWLSKSLEGQEDHYGKLMTWMKDILGKTQSSLSYFIHEYLEEENTPLYFHQFVGMASRFDLQFLSEAYPTTEYPDIKNLQSESESCSEEEKRVHQEQYYDFQVNRTFRQTLLCRKSISIQEAWQIDPLEGFHIASTVKPVEDYQAVSPGTPMVFKSGGGIKIETGDPVLQAAFLVLASQKRQPIPFEELLLRSRSIFREQAVEMVSAKVLENEKEELKKTLLRSFFSDAAQFLVTPPVYTNRITVKPIASPFARYQVKDGSTVTNLRHEQVLLEETTKQRLLAMLDGNHNKDDLLQTLHELILSEEEVLLWENEEITPSHPEYQKLLEEVLRSTLSRFTENALLYNIAT